MSERDRIFRTDSQAISAGHTERKFLDHPAFLIDHLETGSGTSLDAQTASRTFVDVNDDFAKINVFSDSFEALYLSSVLLCYKLGHDTPLNTRP